MLSKEDVISGYRLLLGREPESDSVVTHYATELKDWRALRELFISSAEFQSAIESVRPPRSPKQFFNGPAMQVETTASPEKLAALFAKTSTQWQHLGETEPHWSVLTNDSYYQDQFAMNKQAFFQSGLSEASMFKATLARSGVSLEDKKICLELGCGVGRVTWALAELFDQVLGVDISASHLQIADEYYRDHNIGNVRSCHLQQVEGLAEFGRFDVLYSRIVLQHNPPPVQLFLLRSLLSQLLPGGVGFFQIPTYKAGYRFTVDEYLRVPNNTSMEMHYLPQAALLELVQACGCKILELREDDSTGISVTAISNNLLVEKVHDAS